jgi:RNA polymerase sigma factor (sigma-70 family)
MANQLPIDTPHPHDPLLARLLDTRDEAQRSALIGALLAEQADPVIRRSIRHRLGIANPADVDDIRSAVLLRLFRKLGQLAIDDPIESFANYVATVTYHAVDDYLRKKYPERTLLKNRLRYLLTHDARFALWERDRRTVCGRAAWSGADGKSSMADLPTGDEQRLADSLERIFDDAGAPLDLEAVVALFPSGTPGAIREVEQPDPAVSAADRFEGKELLARLWTEIEELPPRQRTALLLNLRDTRGVAAMPLLPAAGIGMARIAACLGIRREELAAMWNDLPFDDHRIAAMLGATRQQVINLRKSARERLARRLARGNK